MSAPTCSGKQDDDTTGIAAPPKPEIKRINVAVSPDVVRILGVVTENEQVSFTEAVRKLIGYGVFVYRALMEDQAEVLIRKGDSLRKIVVLVDGAYRAEGTRG